MKIKYVIIGILTLFLLIGIAFTSVMGFIFIDIILSDFPEINNSNYGNNFNN